MSTSSKSKSSKADPRRPIAPKIRRQAEAIADRYQIIVWKEDGHYFGRGLELPTTFGDGATVDACMASVREGFVLTVASLLEDGEEPPAPASEENRTEQVNIRLTVREKLLLETAARRKGFRGVSDYLRQSGLGNIA